MLTKEIITCPQIAAGAAPLSQATRFGNLVFVAGNTGRHPTTSVVGKDIKEQTAFALQRIQMILETAGSSLDNVLTNTCYVVMVALDADGEGVTSSTVPTSTEESDAMSRCLKRRGFGFVGTTICYAFMQSAGMVNDHINDCFRAAALDGL